MDSIQKLNPFAIQSVNYKTPKVATTQAQGENGIKTATTQAHAGSENTRIAFGHSAYGDGSITSTNGYGLACGVNSTGIQGAGASSCGGSLNLVA